MIKIKAIVLCAGYATRLYPLTIDTPKPLLEVGGKAILGHLLEKIEKIKDIDEILIVTNHRFHENFRIWLNHQEFSKKVKLINDGTITNEDRLGAIGDLRFVIDEEDINDDTLVIAGDNLFGFEIKKFVDMFKQNKHSQVAFHDLKDVVKVKRKFGVGLMEGNKVIHFEEKPWEPKSSLAATACYLFKKNDLLHINNLAQLGKADAPGHLIKHLIDNSKVNGFVFNEPWYDIGTHESLKEADEAYKSLERSK